MIKGASPHQPTRMDVSLAAQCGVPLECWPLDALALCMICVPWGDACLCSCHPTSSLCSSCAADEVANILWALAKLDAPVDAEGNSCKAPLF